MLAGVSIFDFCSASVGFKLLMLGAKMRRPRIPAEAERHELS
jgi:hypothetical protein